MRGGIGVGAIHEPEQVRQVLEQCAGRAKRGRRFGSPPDGCGNAQLMRDRSVESKAAWRFASRRTARRSRVVHRGAKFRQVVEKRFRLRTNFSIRVVDLVPEFAAHADLAQFNRLKPELEGRGAAFEAEVKFPRRQKKRVRDQRMNVVTSFAPVLECRAGECRRLCGGAGPGVEIEVVVDGEMIVFPIAAQESSGVLIDDVVR